MEFPIKLSDVINAAVDEDDVNDDNGADWKVYAAVDDGAAALKYAEEEVNGGVGMDVDDKITLLFRSATVCSVGEAIIT